MSEMCCTRLAENARRKNYAKNRHLRTIAQLRLAISWQLRHISTIGKKLLYLPHMSSQTAEIRSGVWDTPANFNGFRVLAALLHDCSSGRPPNFAALNKGPHLYASGRPSRWALAHILVWYQTYPYRIVAG